MKLVRVSIRQLTMVRTIDKTTMIKILQKLNVTWSADRAMAAERIAVLLTINNIFYLSSVVIRMVLPMISL
jgi:hypothetical protein